MNKKHLWSLLLVSVIIFATIPTLPSLAQSSTWQIQTVDSNEVVGWYPSLAFGTGPAISYFVWSDGDLKFAYDRNDDGDFTDDGEILTVNNAGIGGGENSLAFGTGPAISYYDINSCYGCLKLAYNRNNDSDFSDAKEIITVDSAGTAGSVGLGNSLAFGTGPAISYLDMVSYNLKFAYDRNDDGDFSDIGEKITVDSFGDVGWTTSLAFDSYGRPAISYYDNTSGSLKFAYDRNNDRDFADTDEIITVDSNGDVGLWTSLAFGTGPAISYYDYTNLDLKFAYDRNNDGDFADPNEIITVDSTYDVGRFTSLAFGTGPAISYWDAYNSDMKFAYDQNNDGDFSDAGEIIIVDNDGGGWTSLAFDSYGWPAISYFDGANEDLKFARHMHTQTWEFSSSGFFPKHLPDSYVGQVVLGNVDLATIPNEVQGVYWHNGTEWLFWAPGAPGCTLTTMGGGHTYDYLVCITGPCVWGIPLSLATPTPSPTPTPTQTTVSEEWVVHYNGPGNYRDWANDIAVDTFGNTYVTGWSEGKDEDRDYATIKYDPNGNELWVARYDGPSDWDEAYAIATDTSGNVYVTGRSSYGDNPLYATIKYDSQGSEQWVARYNVKSSFSLDSASIVVDGIGNIYVACCVDWDYAVIKYDPDGNELWVAHYDGTGKDSDKPTAIALDSKGNIYVTGKSKGYETGNDYATIKYDPNGIELWVARYDGPANAGDEARGLVIDTLDNIYVTGTAMRSYEYVGSTLRYHTDYTTIKYNSLGQQLWVAQYYGRAVDIAIDIMGNIYVLGNTYGFGSYHDYATILKYTSEGNRLWITKCDYGMTDIYADPLGNIYVTGTTDFFQTDSVTAKYNSDGNKVWEIVYNGITSDTDQTDALVVDDLGNVYVTGMSNRSGSTYDYLTIKYIQP